MSRCFMTSSLILLHFEMTTMTLTIFFPLHKIKFTSLVHNKILTIWYLSRNMVLGYKYLLKTLCNAYESIICNDWEDNYFLNLFTDLTIYIVISSKMFYLHL